MFREIKCESEDRAATIQDDRIPPLRSFKDFISNATWNIPDFSDTERLNNRIINNLIYYQTNYFRFGIIFMLLIGLYNLEDFLIGIGVLIAFIFGYGFILESRKRNGSTVIGRDPNSDKTASTILNLVIVCVIICMGMYNIYSLLIVALVILVPILGILIHAMLRKRNIGNKVANQLEKVKLDKTPMARFLAAIDT